jgi:mercuric ion transport protein
VDARKVSLFSIIAASSCCLPPLILLGLTLIGVGTSGFAGASSTLGSLKWYILPLAIIGVGISYWLYFREKRKCSTTACKMANARLTRTMLTISTVVVLGFVFWSIYPYVLSTTPVSAKAGSSSARFAVFQVDGMTCGGCELAIDEAIKATGRVDSVKSSFAVSKAFVWFQNEADTASITEAIASVGYSAILESEQGDTK